MGDVLTLIEQAQKTIDEKNAQAILDKLRKAEFNLEDFLAQMQEMRKIGSLEQILGMLPGVQNKELKNLRLDEKELVHVEANIRSMTHGERGTPQIINGSRRRRIASGSGTSVQQVNRVLQQFEQTKKLMRQLAETDRSKNPFKGIKF